MGRLVNLAIWVLGSASLWACTAASASAVTWHNTGDTEWHATSGPGTLSATGSSFACSAETFTIGPVPDVVADGTWVAPGTGRFTSCTLAGAAATIECGMTFTGTSQSGTVTSGNTDLTCGLYVVGTKLCHVTGAVPSSYTNPSGATAGKLTLNTSSALSIRGASCPLGANDVAELSEATFTATGGLTKGPVLTRTA